MIKKRTVDARFFADFLSLDVIKIMFIKLNVSYLRFLSRIKLNLNMWYYADIIPFIQKNLIVLSSYLEKLPLADH